MSDVPVIRWETTCWKCDEETEVVWPEKGPLDSELGESLAAVEGSPVERVEDPLAGEVWGNVCEHCGAYQDNDMLRKESIKQDPPVVECPVCGEGHEWYPDEDLNVPPGQGWVQCPEEGGGVPVKHPAFQPEE